MLSNFRAIQMVLNRTGFAERQNVDIAFREPTVFERLQSGTVTIERSELDSDDDDTKAPPPRPTADELDAQLESLLAERDRRRERESVTRLDNSGHDVIPAEVPREAPRTAGSRRYERPEDD